MQTLSSCTRTRATPRTSFARCRPSALVRSSLIGPATYMDSVTLIGPYMHVGPCTLAPIRVTVIHAAWLEYLRSIQDTWAQGFCCTTCGKYPATIVVDGTNLICRALFPVDSPTVGMRPYETGRSGIKRSPPIKDQCNPDISLTTSYFRVYMQPL